MLTYVINTSENKTFNSDLLFDLSGYNKIRWIHCPLNEMQKCAEEISEKQNILGADLFRIAVIVDFYDFDKLRVPYARRGFEPDTGVDISLYIPYIESYMLDNLIVQLEKKNLYAADFDIYYVQSEKAENYELLDNAKNQLATVMEGQNGIMCYGERGEEEPMQMRYTSFDLYCTPNVNLIFSLKDYPYGQERMSFGEFWTAFRQRMTNKADLRRHYYLTSYGGGVSRAALDVLSLSLYLIRIFEREEDITGEGNMEVIHLDSVVLKDVLETSWGKIASAKVIAKKNTLEYYALEQTESSSYDEAEPEETPERSIARERDALPKEIIRSDLPAVDLHRRVREFASRSPGDVEKRNRKEFDGIMGEYLSKRDNTRAADIEEEFINLKLGGFLKKTNRCPSREEYEHAIDQRQREISDIFDRALVAGYIDVDYEEEMQEADEAFVEYKKASECLERNIWGDLIFLILSVASMIVPYGVLQLSSYNVGTFSALTLGFIASGIFAGLFVLSTLLQIIPQISKLKSAKKRLQKCYASCHAKDRYAFSLIRRKYERDLINIEQIRYEMRQIKSIYNINLEKDHYVGVHHDMLERLGGCVGGILNQLDVKPVVGPVEQLDGEFDISKPISARENSIYHIFSIETIERMFPKKGSDQ